VTAQNVLTRMTAERRIEQALMTLGLTFAECAGLVVFDPDVPTACWKFDPISEAESIHIGPAIAAMDISTIEIALRHEILHRSMYNGFGEKYANRELSNLTLDVCINRLLFEAYTEKMRKAATQIYPAESKTTPIALADCTADAAALPPQLETLWRDIWNRLPDGGFAPLNPASLYFRLLRLSEAQLDAFRAFTADCRFCGARSDELAKRRPSTRAGKLVTAAAEDINRRLPKGSSLGQALSDYTVVPTSIGTGRVEQFLKNIKIRRIASETAAKVTEPWQRRTRVQPYPTFPTRLGLVYDLAGITDAFHLFWNREVENAGARMAIGIYMDVSGSMIDKFPVVAGFVDALKDFPLRVRSFDTVVHEVDAEDLARGKIRGGGGTDFDAPIGDMLDDDQIEASVLFTDGEANVSAGVAQRLLASRKRLFVVYLMGRGQRPSSPLDHYATNTVTVNLE
jgi:hypothetical protein